MPSFPSIRALLMLALCCVAAEADSARPLEEIVVTGSYVPKTQENGALPVDVIDRDQLDAQGGPSFVELVRNLTYANGSFGESNQFEAAGATGVQDINLRSLGGYRTLTLINSRRHARLQGLGGDLGVLPLQALARMEILKDGAAAIYGSDAMGGVVNLLTRGDFRGLELRAAHQHLDDGGDSELGALLGVGTDRWDWVTSVEFRHRKRVRLADRDWALRPYEENPLGGFSSVSHPARYLPAINGTILGSGGPDPQCELLGEEVVGPNCQLQYAAWDNLVEGEDNIKVFSELNGEFGDGVSVHLEALYGELDIPHRASSPSYPPRSLLGPDRYIAADHPGLVDMKQQNPDLFQDVFGVPAAAQGAFVLNRAEGVSRGPQQLRFRNETFRLAGSLSGDFQRWPVSFDVGVSWSRYARHGTLQDTYIERMAFALDGLGGPGCDPATGEPGVGDCEYYNPFSNGIERSWLNGAVNPQFNPAVANSQALLDWMRGRWDGKFQNDLFVIDATFNGDLPWSLAGGAVSWAAGVQYRDESFVVRVDDVADLDVNPCPFSNPVSISLGNVSSLDCGEPTGQFGFTTGEYEIDFDRAVYAAFLELSLPFTETFTAQLAVRAEDFEGSLGSTVDPKLAVRWQLLPWLALRGSASTTFRAPYLDQLEGRTTRLVFVGASAQYRAVVIKGNPDLDPETALATNIGLLLETERLTASLDFWRFDIEDVIGAEPAEGILSLYSDLGCFNGGPGAGTPDCDGLRDNVFPTGAPPIALDRMEVSWANLVDTKTSGIDVSVRWAEDVGRGLLTLGVDGTYVDTFTPTSDLRELDGVTLVPSGEERAGRLNGGLPITPMPRIKANAYVGYSFGDHQTRYVARYVHSMTDARPVPAPLKNIDSHLTHDLHYHWRARRNLRLSLSVINLTDEDPPRTATAMNYDPFTHNPFGRMVKLGVTASIGVDR